MARQIWSGSLSFGLVNVPVGLVTATESKDVAFHQRERGTNARIRYKRVAEGTNREVDYDDIVKGYEVSGDTFVTLTKDEIAAAEMDKSGTIEITDFVELSDIDPVYFEKTYYLAPRGKGALGAYGLLRDAMNRTGLAGVASFVMRGKEYLAVIRAKEKALILQTLYFADEVRQPEDVIDELPNKQRADSREMKAAVSLIEQLSTDWEPERYHDVYRERLLKIIKDKAKGREVHVEAPAPAGEKVVDLMEALQRSVDQAREGRSGEKKRTTKKAGVQQRAGQKRSSGTRKSSSGRTTKKAQKKAS
jgi:DNA end-binding protein Ku